MVNTTWRRNAQIRPRRRSRCELLARKSDLAHIRGEGGEPKEEIAEETPREKEDQEDKYGTRSRGKSNGRQKPQMLAVPNARTV